MKAIVIALAISIAAPHAAEKKSSDAVLPQKSPDIDDPFSLENLLDPGKPVPEILPNPEALPEAKPSSSGGKITASSAKAALIAAANEYRRKTELFRKGKVSRDALRDSAIRVAQTAKSYRAVLRR